MGNIAEFGNKVIASKKHSVGSAYIVESTDTMWVVVIFDEKGNLLMARNFPFSPEVSKIVQKDCKLYFKQVKDCLCKKHLELLEEL